jgi:hypothetical protein
MELYEKKNKGNLQRTQNLDPLCSPHLEENLIGRNIDLDLLSLFSQKDARIMGGMEEGGQAFKVNNGGEIKSFCAQPKEEEGVFIPFLQKCNYCSPGGGLSGSIRGGFSTPPGLSWSKLGKNPPIYWERTTRNSRGRIIWAKLGRIIRPERINNMKTVLTFAPGLRFR